MDGIASIDAVQSSLVAQLAVSDLASNVAVFNEILDSDILTAAVGLQPATVAIDASSLGTGALAYAVSYGGGGGDALQIIHSVNDVLGQRVDFTG